jgi:hypothetical protein
MDSTIMGAIIGAVATIAAAVLVWLPTRSAGRRQQLSKPAFHPDKDDIYFMQFLLHDAYEQSRPLSTRELAEHHSSYAPLELEHKLIRLERCGYVKRTNRPGAGLGLWQISPMGVDFMLTNGHQLQDLLDEQKPKAGA